MKRHDLGRTGIRVPALAMGAGATPCAAANSHSAAIAAGNALGMRRRHRSDQAAAARRAASTQAKGRLMAGRRAAGCAS